MFNDPKVLSREIQKIVSGICHRKREMWEKSLEAYRNRAKGIEEWEWGMEIGNGEWGMGNGEWGMEIGNGERGILKISRLKIPAFKDSPI